METKDRISRQKIADQFGVDQSTISYINTGRIWSDIQEVSL